MVPINQGLVTMSRQFTAIENHLFTSMIYLICIYIYTLVYLIYLISRSIKYLIYLNILYNMYIINMLSVHSYIKLSDFREDVPSKSGPSNGCVVENCGFWKMFIPKKSLKNQHWTRNMMIIGIGEHVEDSTPV
jgi:hypothetical protein